MVEPRNGDDTFSVPVMAHQGCVIAPLGAHCTCNGRTQPMVVKKENEHSDIVQPNNSGEVDNVPSSTVSWLSSTILWVLPFSVECSPMAMRRVCWSSCVSLCPVFLTIPA